MPEHDPPGPSMDDEDIASAILFFFFAALALGVIQATHFSISHA